MPPRRSLVIPAPDRWLRVIAAASDRPWAGLENGERLGWLRAETTQRVSVVVDGTVIGSLAEEIAAFYHPELIRLTAAGVDAWAKVNVVAVEDRYVVHDYLRPDALRAWIDRTI